MLTSLGWLLAHSAASARVERRPPQLARALLALLCAMAGCAVDNRPRGALVVSLETDLAMPKDIDEVRWEWSQEGRLIQQEQFEVGEVHRLLPTEINVQYPGNDRPVLLRAVALSHGTPRIERSAVTPIPGSWIGFLRLPLNFLCDGQVLDSGESSCGPDQTCHSGACASSILSVDALPRYDASRARDSSALRGLADAGTVSADGAPASREPQRGCFDVASCLTTPFDVEVEPEACAFTLPPGVPEERVNVVLRYPPGRPGVCENGSCFVVLELGSEGYTIAEGRVLLPAALCAQLPDSASMHVALALSCYTRTADNPVCGPWSSVQSPRLQPDRNSGSGTEGVMVGGSDTVLRTLLAPGCAGLARQSCGMCGTQQRSCKEGSWTSWSACAGEGPCAPGATEPCGRGGARACGGDCEWGACESQTCEGPTARACGNCGTEMRRCLNGVWGEWSGCQGQGVCQPNTTQTCGSGGTQACGGTCQWGPCGDQQCAGAPTQACGMCGESARTCSASSGEWSEFGACANERACTPNAMRACGSRGTQTCRGDCTWDSACTGQVCEGASSRACGACGTQTRSCDSDTGQWSEWSVCQGQGACSPDDTRACGRGGTQVCGGNCRWDAACSGQACQGSALLDCGNCGVQARTCDGDTGNWLPPSACQREGECSPRDARNLTSTSCQARGQYCNAQCHWQACCGNGSVDPGELCDGNCPSSCPAAADSCRPLRLSGSAASCDAECVPEPITACRSGDGCCAAGCNANSDRDCSASCGNGVKESGEICDGDCPSSCPASSDKCRPQQLRGSASACNARCVEEPITRCTAGDGCCAPGCNANSDRDCPGQCGNGVLEPGETCDDGAGSSRRCPASCDDGNACTTDARSGSAAACNVQCTHAAISTCASNDGCCPGTCQRPADLDCAARCGDGLLEDGETCDNGTGSDRRCPSACDDGNACTSDARTGAAESCNVVCTSMPITLCRSGDGCCPAGCARPEDLDCPLLCGNGVLDRGELCDPGPGSSKPCPASCDDGEVCTTDSREGAAESCDVQCSHARVTACKSGDGCCPAACTRATDSDCKVTCGDGSVDAPETCDDGEGSRGRCPTVCADDDDACTSDVLRGTPGQCNVQCVHDKITRCASEDGCCPDGCSVETDGDCKPRCGDGHVDRPETCDDGNGSETPCLQTCPPDTNACTTDLLMGTAARCDVVCVHVPVMTCTSNDGCCGPGCTSDNDNDCMPRGPVCGNGKVEAPETCDNGSGSSGRCKSDCNDGDACTTDVLSGSAAECNVTCKSTPITQCKGGDGCCAPGCTNANDSDCQPTGPVCGDGKQEAPETCDDGPGSNRACPTRCDDGNACTTDTLSGSASQCNVKCESTPITQCKGGDGCCPPGCTNANDDDCPPTGPVCGDGKVDAPEKCDDGSGSRQPCPRTCGDTDENACTIEGLQGSAAACNAECVVKSTITMCKNDDSCCPSGCTPMSDNDCR